MDQSRRPVIRIFFNRPVDQDLVTRAFSISPYVPGTFSWSKHDRLLFTADEPLLPATEYTVSLIPMSGSRAGEEYHLLEARWSFTTGEARSYEQDIKPLIAAYCSNCHGLNGSTAAIPLAAYSDVLKYVTPGRSSESRLYTFIQERPHHINMAGPNHSTNDKLAAIKDWIDEGGAAK